MEKENANGKPRNSQPIISINTTKSAMKDIDQIIIESPRKGESSDQIGKEKRRAGGKTSEPTTVKENQQNIEIVEKVQIGYTIKRTQSFHKGV